jgi:hypothetical protein
VIHPQAQMFIIICRRRSKFQYFKNMKVNAAGKMEKKTFCFLVVPRCFLNKKIHLFLVLLQIVAHLVRQILLQKIIPLCLNDLKNLLPCHQSILLLTWCRKGTNTSFVPKAPHLQQQVEMLFFFEDKKHFHLRSLSTSYFLI